MSDTDLDRLARLLRGSHSTSKVEINAGGLGVWLAATCAIACLVAVLLFGIALLYIGLQVKDQTHQLNAIYMLAPHLRPEEKP